MQSLTIPRWAWIIGSLVLFVFLFPRLMQCSNAPEEMPAPPDSVRVTGEAAISGELADYMTIVPGEYRVTVKPETGSSISNGYELSVDVRVRFTQPKDIPAEINSHGPDLTARLLADNGAPLDGLDRLISSVNYAELAGMVKRGKGEEWLTFRTSKSFMGDEASTEATSWLATLQQAKKIGLVSSVSAPRTPAAETSEVDMEKEAEAMMAIEAQAEAEAEGGGSDCAAFLQAYEAYIDEYVALAKQVQADPSNTAVMTRYASLSAKAADFANKSKGCENDPTFAARYAALSAKMATKMAGQ